MDLWTTVTATITVLIMCIWHNRERDSCQSVISMKKIGCRHHFSPRLSYRSILIQTVFTSSSENAQARQARRPRNFYL